MTFNYEESGDGYLATLSYTKQKTTQETENKISTKEKILQLMTENNNITPIALASHIGVSENVIKQQLATLKKEGILQRKGSTKAGYWEITSVKNTLSVMRKKPAHYETFSNTSNTR